MRELIGGQGLLADESGLTEVVALEKREAFLRGFFVFFTSLDFFRQVDAFEMIES